MNEDLNDDCLIAILVEQNGKRFEDWDLDDARMAIVQLLYLLEKNYDIEEVISLLESQDEVEQ